MATNPLSTKNVWPYYSASNVQAAAKETKSDTLGKDDFLKILITQLKYQDPMQPLQDRDFIAQMAQFSSVEQLMNMAGEITQLRQNLGLTSGLIGGTIEWGETLNTGEYVLKSGVVDTIIIRDGEQYAKSGNDEVKISDIISIGIGGSAVDG